MSWEAAETDIANFRNKIMSLQQKMGPPLSEHV